MEWLSMERRYHIRIRVHLLSCAVPTPAKALGPLIGITENVGRNGLLIRWAMNAEAPPVPGTSDRLAVALEWPVRGPAGQIYLCCWGMVVHVFTTAPDEPALVAMKVARMSFQDLLPPSPARERKLVPPSQGQSTLPNLNAGSLC